MPRLFFLDPASHVPGPPRAYDVESVHKLFVGHVRFAADGVPEFAKGWNEVEAPKGRISSASHPSLRASRSWFDAYASPNETTPLAIEPCRCGAKRLAQGLGRPVKPFSKPNPR
jgi:hypothetical protein